jgi:hypothetical protein
MFHEWIKEEIAKIKEKDYIEPSNKIDLLVDHPVGVMDDSLKGLFTLWKRTEMDITKVAKKALKAIYDFPISFSPDQKAVEELQKELEDIGIEASLIQGRAIALEEVFWVSLRDQFPEARGKSLGIRKGFQVVWNEDKRESFLGIISSGLRRFIIPGSPLNFSDS